MPRKTDALLLLPPLALMGLIFFLSAQPNLSSGLGVIDLVGRKIVHVSLFGALCALWWRALRPSVGDERALVPASVIAILYAVTDEYHQSFIQGRNAAFHDVAIDALGAGLAVLAVLWRARLRARPPRPVSAR